MLFASGFTVARRISLSCAYSTALLKVFLALIAAGLGEPRYKKRIRATPWD